MKWLGIFIINEELLTVLGHDMIIHIDKMYKFYEGVIYNFI